MRKLILIIEVWLLNVKSCYCHSEVFCDHPFMWNTGVQRVEFHDYQVKEHKKLCRIPKNKIKLLSPKIFLEGGGLKIGFCLISENTKNHIIACQNRYR